MYILWLAYILSKQGWLSLISMAFVEEYFFNIVYLTSYVRFAAGE